MAGYRKSQERMQEGEKNIENLALMMDFFSFCFVLFFFLVLSIENLSLLFADQFCNQRPFLHAAQKILYFPSACNWESHEAKSLIAFLCRRALYSTWPREPNAAGV